MSLDFVNACERQQHIQSEQSDPSTKLIAKNVVVGCHILSRIPCRAATGTVGYPVMLLHRGAKLCRQQTNDAI